MCVRTTGMFRGGVPSAPSFDDDNVRSYMQEAYDSQTRGSQQSRSQPQEVFGMEDEYDPYSSYTPANPVRGRNEKTADKAGRFFLDDDGEVQRSNNIYRGDQSNPLRAARPFSGMTAAQERELRERDTMMSRRILEAREAALKGDTEKGAFGFVTDPSTGNVVGYTHQANPLGIMGLVSNIFGTDNTAQTYTGDSRFNPFNADAVNKLKGMDTGDDDQPKKTPLDPCPEGFKFDEASQSCQPVEEEKSEGPEVGDSFVRSTQPMPDLSRYGRDGGEYLFFSQMPGFPNPVGMRDGGPPKQPAGKVNGPGGPMDDLVGPIMLSNTEYVLPTAQVFEVGDGDYDRGIRRLDKQRLAALKKYKSRVASA